jgi:pimeloyl-ACP methyl ester carboxylesterase|tara:strand:+ start:483 stop:1340 length:858 start_codon:yes stop_codon:yes gene_type:complete
MAANLRAWERASRLLQASDGRIAVHASGEVGPTILFIHGNSSCKEVFVHQFDALKGSGYHLLALDLPGHGLSDNARTPKQTYSFPGYAQIVREVLDELDVGRVCVVGWSLGGHIGLELLASCSKVEALLITGTPPIEPGPKALFEAFVRSPAMNLAGKREFSDEDVRRYAAATLGDRDRVPPFLLRNMRRTHGDARFWMLRNGLAGHGMNARRLVETDPRPLAILHGTHDPFVDLAYLNSVSYRNLWRGSVQLIEEAGHAPFWENPRDFNSLLLCFLAETIVLPG